jgi:hypothetical protein
MSHHYSGSDFGFPHGDARLDLTDLYAFLKPGDPRKSFVMQIATVRLVVGGQAAGMDDSGHGGSDERKD